MKSSGKEQETGKVKSRAEFLWISAQISAKNGWCMYGKTLFPAYMNATAENRSVMHLVEIKQSLASKM